MPINVTFESERYGDEPAMGVLYEPASSIENPNSVVLLHEWWGVDEFIKCTAERLSSRHGFRCLVVDVFRGKMFTDAKLARENMMTFEYPEAAKDVRAASNYLRKLFIASESGTDKRNSKEHKSVGCIGFGFGAQLSLVSGCPLIDGGDMLFQAIAPVCGTAKGTNLENVCKLLKCPVQGHYAEFDVVKGVSSKDDYDNQANRMKAADIHLEMRIYAAKHAFFNPAYPNFDSRCTEQFFENVTSFMDRNL